MPTSIEAQGVTVEEAIQVALNLLGVTRDRVEIEIIHHPRSGFLGIGARRAKVRATVREAFLADGEEYDMSSGEKIGRGRRSRRSRRRRGGRAEKRDEGEPVSSVRRAEPREPARGREQRSGGSEGDRERRRRGRGRADDRDTAARGESRRQDQRPRQQERERPDRSAPPVEKRRPDVAATQTPARPPSSPPEQHEEERPVEDFAEVVPAPELDRVARDDIRKRAEAALAEILRRMGFQSRVSSYYDEQDSEIVLAVESEAEGLLIGRRGQTLDALEHVLNRIVLAGEANVEGRLAIDVGGYRQRRRETLLELADRLKVRALTQGRRIQVSPMSARDRRILQSALGHDESVRMRVLGSGFYRRVVIFPVGMEDAAAALDVEAEDVAGGEVLEPDDDQG